MFDRCFSYNWFVFKVLQDSVLLLQGNNTVMLQEIINVWSVFSASLNKKKKNKPIMFKGELQDQNGPQEDPIHLEDLSNIALGNIFSFYLKKQIHCLYQLIDLIHNFDWDNVSV